MPRFVDDILQASNGQNAETSTSGGGANSIKIVTDITRRGSFWTLPRSIFGQWLSRTHSKAH